MSSRQGHAYTVEMEYVDFIVTITLGSILASAFLYMRTHPVTSK